MEVRAAIYYRTATPQDEWLMDGLVMCRATLMIAINAPRDLVVPVIRDGLERTTNAVEQLFTDAREQVRACPTFGRLQIGEQREIENQLFNVALWP